jgi:DNA repair exonuclease SbcCD ATPase subunit
MDTTPNNQGTKNWIMMALIAVLAASSIYLYVSKNKQATMATLDISNATTAKQAIQQEYDAALGRLDLMKSENTQMDSLLSQKDGELSALREKIESIINSSNATEGELKLAREMISSLNGKLDVFKNEIAALKSTNAKLATDKQNLTADKESLTREKESLANAKTNLETENKTINEEKEAVKEKAAQLEKKVEVAKVLHASNIKLAPIKHTLIGKNEASTNKAKRADLMRISFNIDDNRISESGEKQVYVVVYNPDGDAYGAGKFKLANGTEKAFSAIKTVPYVQGQTSKDISLDWAPINAKFNKGAYNVEIYHMGYLIGQEKVALK